MTALAELGLSRPPAPDLSTSRPVDSVFPFSFDRFGLGSARVVGEETTSLHNGNSVFAVFDPTAGHEGDKGRKYFVKFGPKADREIRGYAYVEGSPLEGVVIKPHATGAYTRKSGEGGRYLVLEDCAYDLGDGVYDLRRSMGARIIDPDIATGVMDTYLDLNIAWWKSKDGEFEFGSPDATFHRSEWPEVHNAALERVDKLAIEMGITGDDLLWMPITYAGEALPSVGDIMGELGAFYSLDSRPIVFGNVDLSPKNVIAQPATGDFRVIDLEAIGRIDPAEALAIAFKQHSLATSKIENIGFDFDAIGEQDSLHIARLDVSIPPAIDAWGTQMNRKIHQAASAIGLEPSQLARAVRMYMIGGQIHEFAYADKRAENDPLHAFYPLVVAGQLMNQLSPVNSLSSYDDNGVLIGSHLSF